MSARLIIAEACGWRPWDGTNADYEKGFLYESDLPDFLNDLNAMAEAEKTLTAPLKYFWNLYEVVTGRTLSRGEDEEDIWTALTFATAAQRAEAFLRTTHPTP